jgi:hypothetical protein
MRRATLLVLIAALLGGAGCQMPPTPAVFREDFGQGLVTPDTDIGGDYAWSQEKAKKAAALKPERVHGGIQ